MARLYKTEWLEVARRGESHHILTIDGVITLYETKMFGPAHGVSWNPQNYRQYDDARSFGELDFQNYLRVLEKTESRLLRNGSEYEKRINDLRNFSDRYRGIDFKDKDNKYLARIVSHWFSHVKKMWCFVYDYSFLNRFMPDQIVEAVKVKEKDIIKQNEHLAILLGAERLSEQWQEKRSLVAIAWFIKQKGLNNDNPQVRNKIKSHLKNYAHLGRYLFRGRPYDVSAINKRLKSYLKSSKVEIQNLKNEIEVQKKNHIETQKLIKRLKLSSKMVNKIKIVKKFSGAANYADESYSYSIDHLQSLWQEIGLRLGLNFDQVASLRVKEIVEYLEKGKPKDLKKIANQRLKKHAFVLENGQSKIYVGKELDDYKKKQPKKEKINLKLKVLKGQAASPGIVKGIVRLVNSLADLERFKTREVLVSDSTNPTFVPAMEKAAAVVTDEGGLLSHAAIVSRELRVPCIVGTKIGTKVLKNGDRVEVDAIKGVVKKL